MSYIAIVQFIDMKVLKHCIMNFKYRYKYVFFYMYYLEIQICFRTCIITLEVFCAKLRAKFHFTYTYKLRTCY